MTKIISFLRSATGIIALLAVLFLVMSFALFMRYKEAAMSNDNLKREIVSLTKIKKQTALELEELKIIKSDLEESLGELESEARILKDNYERERNATSGIRLEIEAMTADLKQKDEIVKSVKNENDTLRSDLEREMSEYDKLKYKVDKLVEVKNVLEDKIKQIINREGIELERIVVKSEGVLEGRVLVVNRDYGFIVMDIGKADDILPGDIVAVYRNAEFVAEAEVEKVYATMSAATIIREERPGAIKVGDNVVVKGK